MGKRGPKPKPTAIRIFDGTRIQRPSNRQGEPMPTIGDDCPTAPDWLGEHGRKEWNETAPKLHAVGCLTDVDLPFFSQYCQAWDDFYGALDHIREHGLVGVGSQGNDITSPAVKIKNDASNMIHKYGIMFGLSPTSRVGMAAAPIDAGHDDLESFKRG